MVTTHIRKLAHQACAASKWFGLMSGKFEADGTDTPDEAEIIQRQIQALRAYIYSHIIWYVYRYFIFFRCG